MIARDSNALNAILVRFQSDQITSSSRFTASQRTALDKFFAGEWRGSVVSDGL